MQRLNPTKTTKVLSILFALFLFFTGCSSEEVVTCDPVPGQISPTIITDAVPNDSDDPAIWIDYSNPENSLIIGTDKDEDNGGLYVFDLAGKLVPGRSVTGIKKPNNVDVEYGLMVGGALTDIAVCTERNTSEIRVFRLPEMQAIDGGGISVFAGQGNREPMGVSLYKRPSDGAIFAIVSRKSGPSGAYLWQYRLQDNGNGQVTGTKVREFGIFSGGDNEIEAVAVDDQLGYIYYSDEKSGIRKYHADPDHPNAANQLAVFGTSDFANEREGISIFPTSDSTGYILISDQQANTFNIYKREGEATDANQHTRLKAAVLSTCGSDGSEAVNISLNSTFPNGLFVAMSEGGVFHYYPWEDVAGDDL